MKKAHNEMMNKMAMPDSVVKVVLRCIRICLRVRFYVYNDYTMIAVIRISAALTAFVE